MPHKWETYEEVARYLLEQFKDKFGLELVEGKQDISGKQSRTNYEIDGKGVKEGYKGFIIIECKRYTKSRIRQSTIQSLAYQIIDTGAKGGIIVSPLGLQEGASKIAEAENIVSVHLSPNSTTTKFILSFLNEIMLGTFDNVAVHDEVIVKVTNPEIQEKE